MTNSFVQLMDVHVMFWETMVNKGGGILDGVWEARGVCKKKMYKLLRDRASAVVLCIPAIWEAKNQKLW